VAAGGFDFCCALTERLQVFPAERSAEVAQEGDDEWFLPPKL
jgi:hypothetical protein